MNTVEEWIHQFDLQWNNIMSDMAPNLDDYEKSRFLTQAQEQLVISLYDGSSSDNGFEGTELRRRQLSHLLREERTTITSSHAISQKILNYSEYDVTLPEKLLVIVNERATILNPDCCGTPKEVNVVPIKYDELNKVLNNPFRRPNGNKVIRLDAYDYSSTTKTDVARLLTNNGISSYVIEYIKKPEPIILTTLTSPFEIDGKTAISSPVCELDESLHRTIITQAVQLAAAAWASNNKS